MNTPPAPAADRRMHEPMTTSSGPWTPTSSDELHRLLGTVEDWLLHPASRPARTSASSSPWAGRGAAARAADRRADPPARRARPRAAPGYPAPDATPATADGTGIVVNELISTRIRDHATRLALPHLAENLDALLARAEADTMGYLEFVDLLLGEEVGAPRGTPVPHRRRSCRRRHRRAR